MNRWTLALSAAALAWAGFVSGCKGATTGGDQKSDLDADPLALFPAPVVVTANVKARAIFDHGTLGAPIAALAVRFVPLGDDAGFQPARDVDRIALATFPGGADAAAVLSGRFDVAKIEAATRTVTGAEIARASYAGRTTFLVTASGGGVLYSVLSAKTVVAGTPGGTRRVLDRLHAGDLTRALPPWATETLETPGAELAIAADYSTQPVGQVAIGAISLPWLQGLRVARVIGNFEAPGINVAATLTYGEEAQAQAAAVGVRSVDTWLSVLGPLLGGIRLQNLQVTADTANVRCKFALDDHALLAALALAPHLLPDPQ